MLAETFRSLVTDGPHWMFELTAEVVTAVLLAPVARWAWHAGLRRHDAEAHPEATAVVATSPMGSGGNGEGTWPAPDLTLCPTVHLYDQGPA
jgi:hypothetical protein